MLSTAFRRLRRRMRRNTRRLKSSASGRTGVSCSIAVASHGSSFSIPSATKPISEPISLVPRKTINLSKRNTSISRFSNQRSTSLPDGTMITALLRMSSRMPISAKTAHEETTGAQERACRLVGVYPRGTPGHGMARFMQSVSTTGVSRKPSWRTTTGLTASAF